MRPKSRDSRLMRAVLAALVMPVLLAACAPRAKVLATVGSQTITVDDFLDVARGAQFNYGGPPDSAKVQLYHDLLRRALLLEYAVSQHRVADSLVRNFRLGVEENVLRAALFERQVPRNVPVSDGELRQLYAWGDSVTRLQLIYTVERNLADAAMIALRRGEDFSVVANRFNLAGMLPPGGLLNEMPPGSLVQPLDDILRTGRPREVIGPFEAPGEGWFIARVVSRRAQAREPFEQQSMALQQGLTQRKQRVISLRAYQWLRDAYHVTVDPVGAHFMFERYNRLSNGPATDAAPPTPEELRHVLARYDGARGDTAAYTLADAIKDLETDTRNQPNPTMLPSFTQWIENHAVQRAAVLEARRQRLDLEPELAKQIEQRVQNYIVDGIYDAEVVQRASATPRDIQAAYLRGAAMWAEVQSATLEHVTVSDSATAIGLARRAAAAGTLRDAIGGTASGARPREEVVRYPSRDSSWTRLRATLLHMGPGQIGGPVRTARGWLVYRLVASEKGVPPYESLAPERQRAVEQEAAELAREQRLIELTDWLRRTLPVTEHLERLKAIRWPVAGPNGFIG